MMTRLAKAGDTLVAATSSDARVLGYAARQANGDLAILLANRDRDHDVAVDVHLSGFSPAATASVSTYGKTNLGGIVSASRSGIAGTFTITAGAYSLTTVVMTPAGATTPPPVTPPPTTPEAPFTTAIAIPGVIEAEDYDRGGEGVSYHDTSAGNSGSALRSDDVDVENGGNGVTDVGWTASGEWLKYTVTVAASGSYTFAWRVASMDDQAVLHLEDEHGAHLGADVRIPATGGWQTYATVTTTAALTAGGHVLKVVVDQATAGGNIDKITVSAAGTVPPPPTPAPGASAGGGGGKSGCGFGSGLAALLMGVVLALRAMAAWLVPRRRPRG